MNNAAKVVCGLALAGMATTTPLAQEMRPDRAVKYRQGVMYAMNANLGVLSRMVKGEIPFNKDSAVRSARFSAELSEMPWDGFVPVSHEGGKTKAKADIWKDKAQFDKLAQAMQAEMPKLVAAAQTGDVAQLKSALGPVAKSCDNCHDKFTNE
ncbi:MAG: cytochrome c [Betaproteobacteria bacterium]